MPYGLPLVDENGRTVVDPGSQEETNQSVLALRNAANAAVSMPLTMIAPDPKLPGALGYVPFAGAGESAVGLLDFLGRNAARLGNAAMPSQWGLHIPDPPDWMRAAGEHFEQNRGDIKSGIDTYTGGVLKAPDMDTTTGLVTDILGGAVGGGIGIAPTGMIAPVLSALPRMTRPIASLMFPTTGHMATNIPLSTALGTTLGGIDLAAQSEMSKASTDKGQVNIATPPATSTILAQSKQPTPQPTSDVNSILFGDQPPGPTFTQQGNATVPLTNQEVPLWAAGASLIVTLGALAGGRYMHGLGAKVNTVARDARFNNPDYAAAAQQYSNEVIARGSGSGSVSPPGGSVTEAPIPEGSLVRRVVTNIASATSNDAAKMQDYARLTADNPAMAERLSAMIGNHYDTQLQQNKTLNFLESGYDKRTGITIPSVQKLLDDYTRLTPQQKITLGDGLKSLNEMDNRVKNTIAWKRDNPDGTPTLSDVAHDFMGKPLNDLHGMAANMRSDPVLADFEQRFKQISNGLIDIGGHQSYGFFSPTEVKDLKAAHPNYSPETDIEGRVIHPFGERNTSPFTGQAQSTSHPITDLAQHVELMYPLFEQNILSQELYKHQMNVQRVHPQSAQLMTDVTAPSAPHTNYYPIPIDTMGGQPRDPIVTVRTPEGPKYLRVDQGDLYHAMGGLGLTQARVRLGAIDNMRKLYQQGTTGMMSAMTGRAVPLRNAIYTAVTAPVNAPKNMYGGLLDRIVQRTTGHTSAIARGLDMPLNVPAAAASYLRGVFDRQILNRFADLTHPNANNVVNRMLRSTIGDTQVDAMHQSTKQRYLNSATHWIKEMGVSGQGSPMHLEAPGVLTGEKAGPFGDTGAGMRMLSARLSPKAFFSGQWMGAKPFVLNVQRAVGEAMSNMSDAGHHLVMRLNRGNTNLDPETLTYETRNLVGNPARKGSTETTAGKLVQGAGKVLPYTNVSVQGTGRIMRSVGERPVSTAVTLATGLGSMALLSILTHMRSAAHLDYLQNELSLQQREANVSLGLNDDPTKPTMLPLPQELRAPYAFMLDVMSKAVNTIAMRHDPDVFNMVWNGLQDFFGGHITTSNALAMKHGLIDVADFANLPPIVGRIDWNAVTQGRGTGAIQPVWSGAATPPLPGQAPDTGLDSKVGQQFMNVLSNVFGAFAHVLDIGNNTERYYYQGHPFWDSMGMGIHDWLQISRESNLSLNNLLWETPVRLSTQPPIAETLQPTLYALKNLPPIVSQAQIGYTTKGPNQLPVPQTQNQAVSTDPLVSQMLRVAHGYSTRIQQAMQPINAIRSQMGVWQKQGMDPEQRRVWLNQQTRNMADRYKLVDSLSDDMNAMLTKLAGKNIHVQDIDWQKDSSQFR